MSRGELVEQVGRCKACGRRLKDPLAIAVGYGRACAAKAGVSFPRPGRERRRRRAVSERLRALKGTGDPLLFPDRDAPLITEVEQELDELGGLEK